MKLRNAYDREIYKEVIQEAPQAFQLANLIINRWQPKSIIDLGCGTGLYLWPFKNRKTLGIDISPEAFDDYVRRLPKEQLIIGDLTSPWIIGQIDTVKKTMDVEKWDLALCIETLEHIEQQYADQVVKNLCSLSDLLIVTAAGPGQAGTNHLNLQPLSYWEEKFSQHGYKRQYADEFYLVWEVAKVPHEAWLIRNLMVLKKTI